MPADAVPAFLWVESVPDSGDLTLDPEASHYVGRVCRGRVGEALTLTDGRGLLAEARIAAIERRVTVEIERLERRERLRRAVLLCGAPEGERADWMVEKLAELGVAALQPVQCERREWARTENKLDRWRRLAFAALRQSRQCWALEILPPCALADALVGLPADAGRFLAEPSGLRAGRFTGPETAQTIGAVGPSEGLTAGERGRVLEAGFIAIALSDSRLRTETAALAWAAWWAARGKGNKVDR